VLTTGECLLIEDVIVHFLLLTWVSSGHLTDEYIARLRERGFNSDKRILGGGIYKDIHFKMGLPVALRNTLSIEDIVISDEVKNELLENERKTVGPPLYTEMILKRDILRKTLIGRKMRAIIRVYPVGIACIDIQLRLKTPLKVEELIAIVNSLIYVGIPLRLRLDQDSSNRIIIVSGIRELGAFLQREYINKFSIQYTDIFTILHVIKFSKSGGVELVNKYREDFKGLFIRAIRYYKGESDIVLKNQALEPFIIFRVTMPNAFLYVPMKKVHYTMEAADAFIFSPLEAARCLFFALQTFNVKLNEVIKNFSRIYRGNVNLKQLNEALQEIENLRYEIIRTIEYFRCYKFSLAFRARWYFDAASKAFTIDELNMIIKNKLEDVATLVTRIYQLLDMIREKRLRVILSILNFFVAGTLAFKVIPVIINLLCLPFPSLVVPLVAVNILCLVGWLLIGLTGLLIIRRYGNVYLRRAKK